MKEHFQGMHAVHTINNACLTIWGLTIGGTDLTRVIGETVAMGMDNDCTAATAGCICGAVIGKEHIPAHWTALSTTPCTPTSTATRTNRSRIWSTASASWRSGRWRGDVPLYLNLFT